MVYKVMLIKISIKDRIPPWVTILKSIKFILRYCRLAARLSEFSLRSDILLQHLRKLSDYLHSYIE